MMGLLPQLMKKAKKKGAKGAELLSPAAMTARFFNKGGDTMLTGGQKKLDKNKDGKISGEDFKMMKAKTGKDVDIDLMEKIAQQSLIGKGAMKTKVKKRSMGGKIMKAYEGAEAKGYGAARTQGEGLQDENLIPGKSMDYYKDIV